MELEKELCMAMMLGVVSEMSLEDKSLGWLKKEREKLIITVANCERSAREIRQYVINEYNGRDDASEEVKELKDKLVDAIELQAKLEKVVAERLGDEIEKRLETLNER